MGRRGPLPKLERTRNDRVPTVSLGSAPIPTPTPPNGLLAVNRRRWERYFASEVARAVTEVDLPSVERLWVYYDGWERARRAGDVAEMVRLERPIAGLENQLGLTPSARARLGIHVGQARRLSLVDVRRQMGAGA